MKEGAGVFISYRLICNLVRFLGLLKVSGETEKERFKLIVELLDEASGE